MGYPPSPWTLKGYGFLAVQLIDIERIRSYIPDQLEIIPVFPGKTIGGIYISCYEEGSTLIYNELIVACAMVRYNNKVGGWVSHIYVDNPDSVAGGRNIWGMPKELAEFTWKAGSVSSVQVSQSGTPLCEIECTWQLPGWYQNASGSVFSLRNRELISFTGDSRFKFHLAGINVKVPASSPFADIGIDRPLLGFYLNPLNFVANPPVVIAAPHREKVEI